MSVINKMLQDLDRRNAMAGVEAQAGAQSIKALDPDRKTDRDWFWRVVAALLLVAVGWVMWVAYQLLPRPLVTDEVFRLIQAKPAQPAVSPVVVAPVAEEKPSLVPVAVQAEAKPTPPEPAETFKLARAIETPILERKPVAPKFVKPAPPKFVKPAPPKPAPSKLSKTPRDDADAQFRRAALFLNQGRVSEAEAHLAMALKTDPAHAPARQAYVALLLEQGRVEHARAMLEQAAASNPDHAPFALALARIHVEQRDYPAALEALDRAGSSAQTADFHRLRAVVLQRMGRHADAANAYQQALRTGPQNATTWMGLGISLEALGHRAEAAQAYKRALGAGALAREARDYAQARIKALD
ncbi:MAG TPA: tetratricopeptide repeat protein [Burkholderiales bacterium]|nr:tetratricopeptide repeat protein [Burkholderiales bacterium]